MANRGRTIEILDDSDNLLYPKTSAINVLFGNNGETVGGKLGDALTDIGNLKTLVNEIDTEVDNARNAPNFNYPNLKARLDAIEDQIGGNVDIQEVIDARVDANQNPHAQLKERLKADYDDLDGKTTENKNTIRDVKNEVEAARTNNDTPQVTYPTLKERLDAMDAKCENSNQNFDTLNTQLGNLSNHINAVERAVGGVTSDLNDLALEVTDVKSDIIQAGVEIGKVKDEIEIARANDATLDARLDRMEAEIGGIVGGGGVDLSEITDSRTDMAGDTKGTLKDRLESDYNSLNTKIEDSANKATEAINKVGVIETDIHDAKTDFFTRTEHSTLFDRLESDFKEVSRQLSTHEGSINGQQAVIRNIQTMIRNANTDVGGQQFDTLKERLDSDYNMLDGKFDNYLPLTGGNVDSLSVGNNPVWHSGNFNPADKRDNLAPQNGAYWQGTPLINTGTGDMQVGKSVSFYATNGQTTGYDHRLVCNGDWLQSTKGLASATSMYAMGNYYVNKQQGVVFQNPTTNSFEFGISNIDAGLQFGVTGRETRIVGSRLFVQNADIYCNRDLHLGGNWSSGECAVEHYRQVGQWGKFSTRSYATAQNINLATSGEPCHTIEVYKWNDTGDRATTQAKYFFAKDGFAVSVEQDGIADLGHSGRRWKGVYCTDGVQQSSDMARKADIRDIDDNIFYNLLKNTGVHSYVLRYDGMPDDITQETAPKSQIHIGVVAQQMDMCQGSEYILDKCQVDEDGTEEFFLNNYNYASAIHAGLKVLIGKHEMLDYEHRELTTKFNNEVTKRKALEKTVEDLIARIEQLEVKLP